MAEHVYLNRAGARITSARAIFGNKTYALATITSLEGRKINPERSVPYKVVLGGVVACAVSAFMFVNPESRNGVVSLLIGVVLIAAGVVWASRIGPTYAVILCTAAGKERVCTSANEWEINEVVAALNQAIIDRGQQQPTTEEISVGSPWPEAGQMLPVSTNSTEAKYAHPLKALAISGMVGLLICGVGLVASFCFLPLGICIILGGVVAVVLKLGDRYLEGACPHCGHGITVEEETLGFTCDACRKRSVVRANRFVRVD